MNYPYPDSKFDELTVYQQKTFKKVMLLVEPMLGSRSDQNEFVCNVVSTLGHNGKIRRDEADMVEDHISKMLSLQEDGDTTITGWLEREHSIHLWNLACKAHSESSTYHLNRYYYEEFATPYRKAWVASMIEELT